jgi:phospholipase C
MLRMFARYSTDTSNIVSIGRLAADAASGNLPSFTFVEPALHHHPQNDDHPPADMHRGQVFLRSVYQALRSGPAWEKTLLIITYDEHGGLYDHVVPPTADVLPGPEPVLTSGVGTAPAAPAAALLVPYGVRVPTFVVSPWTVRGKGPTVTLDHCSILKTVLARFLGSERPFLSDRVAVSHSFDGFLTETRPRLDVPVPPALPDLPLEARSGTRGSAIVTKPLTRREMREQPVDYHDLTGRWARQLGR